MSSSDLCRLLVDAPASGAWNMAVDEALLESAAERDECCWRFYRWEEPTLSLGYFQDVADRRRHAASVACPLVRRPSGGGAIVHDIELTYSVALPAAHRLAQGPLRRLYEDVHEALVETTRRWGTGARVLTECPAETCSERPFLCFQRHTRGDVVYGAHKIAGSAQRRTARAILQHGSLLLGRSAAAPELPGLADLVGRDMDEPTLMEAWLARLADRWALRMVADELGEAERTRATALVAAKYGAQRWTLRRNRGEK